MIQASRAAISTCLLTGTAASHSPSPYHWIPPGSESSVLLTSRFAMNAVVIRGNWSQDSVKFFTLKKNPTVFLSLVGRREHVSRKSWMMVSVEVKWTINTESPLPGIRQKKCWKLRLWGWAAWRGQVSQGSWELFASRFTHAADLRLGKVMCKYLDLPPGYPLASRRGWREELGSSSHFS